MIITEYHRPTTLQEALTLLGRSDVVSRPLGGGTILNGLPDQVPDAVVDLQALDLDGIGLTDGTVTLGAMTTLNSMSRSEAVPGVLRELARREAPSTIRNVATVGGTVGGRDGLSGLLAGLLAFGAVVELATKDGSSERSLAEVLADKSSLDLGIITSVSIMTNGEAAFDSTARTPADKPIVLVVGHVDHLGEILIAATGLIETPSIIDHTNLDNLDVLSDFRGSADYRRHLGRVLGARVADQLGIGDRA